MPKVSPDRLEERRRQILAGARACFARYGYEGATVRRLEDETGLLNIVVSKGCWAYHRRVVRTAAALLVRGRLERVEGVTNVIAERIEALPIRADVRSRDFR